MKPTYEELESLVARLQRSQITRGDALRRVRVNGVLQFAEDLLTLPGAKQEDKLKVARMCREERLGCSPYLTLDKAKEIVRYRKANKWDGMMNGVTAWAAAVKVLKAHGIDHETV